METTAKQEILNDLKELKNKGVNVLIHDSFLSRGYDNNVFTMNSGSLVISGATLINGNNGEIKINLLKNPNELIINIYLNSTEEEIKNQISSIQNHLKTIEKEGKSSAIVDFLKEELEK